MRAVGHFSARAPDRPVKGHRCIRSLTASALAVGLLIADVVSPDRPVLSHRFIRCSLSPLPLSQYCTGALLLWGTGVSGPEDLLIGCLTCSLLALLKYPFYPLFNFDNGMNLISKSLTILTSAQLLVVFAGFWPILEHEMTRPMITQ